MKTIKQFNAQSELWMRTNRELVSRFVIGFVLATVAAIVIADIVIVDSGEHFDGPLIAAHGLVVSAICGLWCALARLRRTVAMILAASLLFGVPAVRADEPPEEPLVWFVAGAVVFLIVGGTIIGCRAKRCADKVSSRTNAWPAELNFHAAGAPMNYGAAFSEGELGYCALERGVPATPVSFVIDIYVDTETNAFVTTRADVGERYVVSLWEKRQEIAVIGLELATGPGRFESFSRNGQPVTAEQMPLCYNWDTHICKVGDGGVLVTIESSTDLQSWEPLLKFDVEPGSNIEASDATDSGRKFYRVTTATP